LDQTEKETQPVPIEEHIQHPQHSLFRVREKKTKAIPTMFKFTIIIGGAFQNNCFRYNVW
jgi:hypothetical protein